MTRHKSVKQTVKNGEARKPVRTARGRFAPGNAGGPGRPVGTPNSFGAQIKADLLEAYYERGGKEYLRQLPDALFVRLLAIGLPREKAEDAAPSPTPPTINVEIYERVCRLLDQAAEHGLHPDIPGLGQMMEEEREEGRARLADLRRRADQNGNVTFK